PCAHRPLTAARTRSDQWSWSSFRRRRSADADRVGRADGDRFTAEPSSHVSRRRAASASDVAPRPECTRERTGEICIGGEHTTVPEQRMTEPRHLPCKDGGERPQDVTGGIVPDHEEVVVLPRVPSRNERYVPPRV